MPPIKVLELFAGIGGQALALKSAGMKTIGYCEKNPWSHAVLQSNMLRGRLDQAPIFPDVCTLRAQDLPTKPDMIAGGFPCLGLSTLGKRRGLLGDARSALILHVYRLIDEVRPEYVFLENTPAIVLDKDFKRLLRELTSRDYNCAFIISTASQQGAAHLRRRWFLLARHRHAPPLQIPDS